MERLKGLLRRKKGRWEITEKAFLSLFFTGVIIEFSQVGAGFIDGLIISRFLGADAMAAEGIAYPIFSILGVVSGLLAVGMQVRCSQALGRGNREEYFRFVSAVLLVGGIVSVVLTAALLTFARPLSALLGASGNAAYLLEPATDYMIGIVIGALPLVMTAIISPVLQLDSGRKIIQYGAIVGGVSNILMDIVAVKLDWGIFGVGLATAVSNYLNLFVQCSFFFKKDRIFRFVKPNVSLKEFSKMLINGSEKAIKRLTNTLRPIFLNSIIISFGGAAAMSVLSVYNNFSSVVRIFGVGIASAVALLSGLYYGEMNEEGIEEVDHYSHKLMMIFTCTVGFLTLVFAKLLARLYVADSEETYQMTVFAFRMIGLQLPLWSLIESRVKYLQAVNKKYNMNVLIVTQNILLVILSALILGKLFGSYGVLACYTVSDTLSLISIYIFYVVKCRKGRPQRKDFLNLPEYFHLNPGDVISLDIRDEDDVSLVSEQIMMFCKGHKVNERISYFASLAFEELAANIVQYGFPKNRSSHPVIDVRAVIKNDMLVLDLRDNCPQYDITKHMAEIHDNPDDIFHNIGTRIVSKIASDIIYLRTFDTNNVIIQFKLNDSERLAPSALKASAAD